MKFDFLRPDQAVAMLRRHCELLSLEAPGEDDVHAIRRLPRLTPGDFAAVLRQNRFRPIKTAERWVTMLQAECALKEGRDTTMSFLA